MRRFAICLAFAASLTLVLAAGSPARRVSQAPPVKFTDAGGDSGTAADITTVAVTNDDKGQYRLDLAIGSAVGSPVKAGGTWNVGIAVIRSDTGKTLGPEATIACKGTSGATKLAVTARAFVSGGSGGASAALCLFKVPKKLRHKPL